MKRSTPLRRTAALRTSSTLARRTRIAPRSKTNSYRKRERDVPYMLWVKTRPCIVREIAPHLFMQRFPGIGARRATPCSGPVEADHMGARGMGQKADDRTCVPCCRHHHGARHAHAADFYPLTRDELRAWRTAAIERTQAAWENR